MAVYLECKIVTRTVATANRV